MDVQGKLACRVNACIKRVFRITLENLELIRASGLSASVLKPSVFIRSGADLSVMGQPMALCDVNKDNSTDRSISVNGAPFHFLTY